jgi:hypothetical protein
MPERHDAKWKTVRGQQRMGARWRVQAAVLSYGCDSWDDRRLSCDQDNPGFEIAAMVPIPDDDLQRLAAERGPGSVEANALDELRRERAQDKQVSAYRLGDFIVVGPEPSAQEELVFLLANEATKHLKGSKPSGE